MNNKCNPDTRPTGFHASVFFCILGVFKGLMQFHDIFVDFDFIAMTRQGFVTEVRSHLPNCIQHTAHCVMFDRSCGHIICGVQGTLNSTFVAVSILTKCCRGLGVQIYDILKEHYWKWELDLHYMSVLMCIPFKLSSKGFLYWGYNKILRALRVVHTFYR